MAIKIAQKSAALYQDFVNQGLITVYNKGSKYELVENGILNEKPIPLAMTEEAVESESGKEYKYGSLLRLNTGTPLLDKDFPFQTKAEREAYQNAGAKAAVNIGMFRLKETITTENGKVIPAGHISLRAFMA